MANINKILKAFLDFRNTPEYQGYDDVTKGIIKDAVKQKVAGLQGKRDASLTGPAYEKSGFESFAENPVRPVVDPVVETVGNIGQKGVELLEENAPAVLNAGIEAADYVRKSPKVMGPLLKAGGAAVGGSIGSAAGPVGGAIGGIKGYQLGLDLARAIGAEAPAAEVFPAKKDAGLAYDVGTFAEQNIAPVAQLGLELSDPTFFLRKLGTGAIANVAEKQKTGVAPAEAISQTIEENAPTALFLGAGPLASKLAKAAPYKSLATALDYSVPATASAMELSSAKENYDKAMAGTEGKSNYEKVRALLRSPMAGEIIKGLAFPTLHAIGNAAKERSVAAVEPKQEVTPEVVPVVEPPKPAAVSAPEKLAKKVIAALNTFDVPAEQQVTVIRNITGRIDAGFDNLTQNEASAVRAAISKKMRKNTEFQPGDFGTEKLPEFPPPPEPNFQQQQLPAFPKEQQQGKITVIDRRAEPGASPRIEQAKQVLSQTGIARPVALGRPIERTSVQEVVDRLRGQLPQEQVRPDRRAVAQPEAVKEPPIPEPIKVQEQTPAPLESPVVEPPEVQIKKNASVLEQYQRERNKAKKAELQKQWDALPSSAREEAIAHLKDRAKALPLWQKVDKAVVEGKDVNALMNQLGSLDPVAVNEARKLIPEPTSIDMDVAKLNAKDQTKHQTIPDTKSETPVMDAVESLGRIVPKGAAGDNAKGEYDAQPKLAADHNSRVFSSEKGRFKADQMARELQSSRGIGDGTAETMWKLIEQEANARKSGKQQAKGTLDADKNLTDWEQNRSQVVTANDLKVGDEFTAQGERFKVIEENDSSLKLKDGVEIDVPYEGRDNKIRIDRGSLKGEPVAAPVPAPEMFPAAAEKSMQNRPLYSVEYLVAKGLKKAINYGTNLLRQGVTTFVDWSRKMAAQFGDKVKGNLVALWKAAKDGFMGKVEGRRGAVGFRGFDKNAIKKGVDISREAVRQEERAKMPDKAAVKKGVDIAVAAGKEKVQERMNFRLEKKQAEADALRLRIAAVRKSGKSLEEKRNMLAQLAQEGVSGNRDFIRAIGLVKKAKTEKQVDKAALKMAEIIATGAKDREWRQEFEATRKAFQKVNKEKGKMHPVFQAVLGDKIKGVTDASPTVEKQTERFLERAAKLLKDENVRGMLLESERFGETIANLRNKKSLRDMDANELRELRDTLLFVSHASKTSEKLIFEGKMQDVNETSDEMYKSAEAVKENLKTEENPVDGSFRKSKNQGYLGQLETSLNSLPALARKVFGKVGEKVLGRDFWQAENKATELIEKGNDTVSKWRKASGLANDKKFQDWQNEQVTIESSGVLPEMDAPKPDKLNPENITMTRGELLDLAAAIGDRSTRLRLMGKDGNGGNPVVIGNTTTAKRFILSESDMVNIESQLTPQERSAVDVLKKYLSDTLVPEMDKAHVSLMGYPLKKIEGYWPRRPSQSFSQTGLNEAFNSMLSASYESLGMLKERQEHNKPLVVGNYMDTFSRHVNSGSEMAAFGVPMRNARMVLGNPKVKLAFDKFLGKNVSDTLDQVLTNVLLRSQKGTDPATGAFGELQNLAGRAALAFNPLSAARGLTGAGNLVTEFEPADLWQGIKSATKNRKSVTDEMLQHPYFKKRAQAVGESIISTDAELPELQKKKRQYSLITGADNFVSAIAWEAAKAKVMREKPALSGTALTDAVAAEAEAAVRKTQNPVSILDAAPMIQEWGKDPIKKTTVMFRSQGPKNIEVLRRISDRYRDGEISGQRAIAEMLAVIAAQQVGKRISVKNAMALGGGAAAVIGLMKKENQKDESQPGIVKFLGSEVADAVLNQADNVPVLGFFAGNAPDLLEKYFDGKLSKTDVESKSSPGITALQDSLEASLNLMKAALSFYNNERAKGSRYKQGEEKYKKPLLDGVKSGVKAGAALTGSSLFYARILANIIDAAGRDALGLKESDSMKKAKTLLKQD